MGVGCGIEEVGREIVVETYTTGIIIIIIFGIYVIVTFLFFSLSLLIFQAESSDDDIIYSVTEADLFFIAQQVARGMVSSFF